MAAAKLISTGRSVFDWRVPPSVAAEPVKVKPKRKRKHKRKVSTKVRLIIMRRDDDSLCGLITFKDAAAAVRFLSQRLIEHPNSSDPFRFERTFPGRGHRVGSSIRPDTIFVVDYADGRRRLYDTFYAANAACGFRLLRGVIVAGLSRKERIVKSAQGMYGFELVSIVDGHTGKLTVFVRELVVGPVDPDVIESEEDAIDRQLEVALAEIDAKLAADLAEIDAKFAAEVPALETPEADTLLQPQRCNSPPLARDPSPEI